MIEAPELVTATQRQLYDHYRDIHRKFFPSPPPVFAKPKPVPPTPPPVIVEPAVQTETETEQSLPALAAGAPVALDQTNLRLKIIKRAVCAEFGINEQTLLCERRTPRVVIPRHMFSYLASKFTMASLPRLGKALGGQDHTTIMHGIRRTKVRIRIDPIMCERALRLEAALRQAFGETCTPRNCIGRYVEHSRVAAHFELGWMWAANLNEYAALMIWPCACECVEPKE